MPRDLAYLVAVGAVEPRFLHAVEWCVTSLRRWGCYAGEIAVITDQPAGALPAAVRAEATVIQVDESRLRDAGHGRSAYDRYLMARLRVHHLLDVAAHDRVLYVDCDVLAIRDVMPLLEGLDAFRYSREFQPMAAPMYNACLTDAELEEARWRRGINSGVYAAPGPYLGECLDRWKALLDSHPRGKGYDQPALNALVLRGLIRARPLPALSVGYPVLPDFAEHFREQTRLLHYCGTADRKFAQMAEHFEDLRSGRPPRMPSAPSLVATTSFFRQPPAGWRAGPGPDRRLAVAFDDDGRGPEAHSLVNARWSRELQARGHYVIPLDGASAPAPDVVIHHNYLRPFRDVPWVAGARHVAVRTSDFGPFPPSWGEVINARHDQLWVHSRWMLEQAMAGGVEAARIRVVPHGIDPDVFRPEGPRALLPTRKSFAFLFVGGTVRRKGIDILLSAYARAFRRDDDVCLVVKDHAGNAFYREGTERDEVRRRAADPAGPEIVYFHRPLTTAQLAALYRACQVAVFPYRAEGFLIPALEALACGVPTIVPRFGACLDFSDEQTSYLVTARRIRVPVQRTFRLHLGFDVDIQEVDFCEVPVAALADTMREAYAAGEDALARKGAAGAARARAQFTWRHAGDRLERCLRELAGSPPAPQP